jgi:hypothetical protein
VTPGRPNLGAYFGVVPATGLGCPAVACHKPRCLSAHTEELWSTPRKRAYVAPKDMKMRDIPLEGLIFLGYPGD